MNKKHPLIIIFTLFLLHSCGSKKENKDKQAINTTTEKKFEANWESIKKNYKDPEWFNKVKFGIFIHWGAYSVPAYNSEWYPRNMYMDTATFSAQLKLKGKGPNTVYTHHKDKWGDQKKFGYKDFIPMFKGEKFNADEWINLFKKAGAKYVIPVADHHDGFAMYKSNTTRWNSYNMGPKRDILGELFKAGRSKDMIMGTSSHFAFNWSFYNKKDHFDTTDPQYADLYSSKGKDLTEPASEKFKQRWWERTKDVIDNYQPDIFWLDFYVDIPDFEEYRPKFAAYYYNKGIEWGKEVVINDKNLYHEAFPEGTVIYDLERGKLPGIRKLPWQTDTSIGKNSWCYVENWESKSANKLVHDLIDIVSKNGNLLLNIGPKSDGTIPDDQQKVLLQIGKWLAINGEAIYDTKYWDTFGEGPTKEAGGYMSEHKESKGYVAEDIRFTQKDGKIYAIMLGWPKDGKITIKSFSALKNIKNIKMLGDKSGANLEWSQDSSGVHVKMPTNKPCDYAYTLEVSF